MRSIILGAGAIGGVVGGYLARAGRDVVLVARGAHADAMREHGLRVDAPAGAFVVRPRVIAASDRVDWRAGDAVWLAVKTQDAAAAVRDLAPPPHVPIACLTNGIEAERLALRHVDHVYGVSVRMPGTHLEPGVVQGWGSPVPGLLDLGRYPDGAGDHADELAGELVVAGFESIVRPNIMKWKRGKLLSNLANGAEALCGPAARNTPLAEAARAEGRACFAAANLACTTDAEDTARRGEFRSLPIAGARRAGGSTWQSLVRGHATLETDYLNGEIAMLGRLHGVPTPVNSALQQIAADAARAGVAPGSWSLDQLAARVAELAREM
jgi:2-dehydropantoate 2-reductase